MTAVVSGANGFIGSLLVKKLCANGIDTIALVKDKNEDTSTVDKKARICYCDFGDIDVVFDEVSALVKGECIVYHFAWMGVNGALKADYRAQTENIKMTCDCALLAKRLNARRFLTSGTVAENAVKSYSGLSELGGGLMYATAKASAKLFVETVCKNIGLPYVWMQFSNIFGPTNKTGNLISYTIDRLRADEDATFGPALQPYDFIYSDDLIEAAYRLGTADALTYNEYFIGSGKPRILKDYLLTVGELMGKPERIKIGVRRDDGIKYDYGMFDTAALKKDIGEYVSLDFDDAIRLTLDKYDEDK